MVFHGMVRNNLTIEGFQEARECQVDQYGRVNGFKRYSGQNVMVIVFPADSNQE